MIDFSHMSDQEYTDFLSVARSKAAKNVYNYLISQPEESVNALQKRLYNMKDRVSTLFGLDYYATKAEILILENKIKSRK